MGIFSKRKEALPLPQIENIDAIAFDLQGTAESAGALIHEIVKNEALMTYITKTLGPKLVRPAMMQDMNEVIAILKADPVVGALAMVAYSSFVQGYTNA